jgi:hypothetical protein
MFITAKASKGIAIAILACGLSISCSKRPSDETISKDIQDKISVDPVARDSNVVVSAKDGTVTLTGTTKNAAAQQRAEQIAREEPGAVAVDDQLTATEALAPASDSPTPAAAPAMAAAPAPAVKTEKPKPKPKPLVIPTGTALTIRVGQALSSKTSQEGGTFVGALAEAVSVDGKAAIPAGAAVTGTVVSAKSKGKIKGEGQLALSLTNITVKGRNHTIQTAVLDSTVKGKGKRTAVATGGGAAGGALIGGIAGGGKGAGIGALVGAGAGLLGGALTGNKQVEIPAESALTFTLSAPLTLSPAAD